MVFLQLLQCNEWLWLYFLHVLLAEPFYSKAMDRFVEFVMDNIDRLPAQLHVIIYDITKAGQNQLGLTILHPLPTFPFLQKIEGRGN